MENKLGQSFLGLLMESLLCDDHGISEIAFERLGNVIEDYPGLEPAERENLRRAWAMTDATDGRFYLPEIEED